MSAASLLHRTRSRPPAQAARPQFTGFHCVHGWLGAGGPTLWWCSTRGLERTPSLDNWPSFAVGTAPDHRTGAIAGDPDFSSHPDQCLVADGFDISMCDEMLIDRAVTIPMGADVAARRLANQDPAEQKSTPVQHPLPSLALHRGRSLGPRPRELKVESTSALSYRLDGAGRARAGFTTCMDRLRRCIL